MKEVVIAGIIENFYGLPHFGLKLIKECKIEKLPNNRETCHDDVETRDFCGAVCAP